MPKVQIARPDGLSEDKREELRRYLVDMWKRALDGRTSQVDGDYARWAKVYAGTPMEKERTVPFYKASNLVVPLVRIFIDTFVARTLNIMFATKPLYIVEGLPTELQEAWQAYVNQKAIYSWNHYKVARDMCMRGSKNGSVVFKTLYTMEEASSMTVSPAGKAVDETYTVFEGPESRAIPFEDFYVYPITAEDGACSAIPWKDVVIKFHRVRYPEETARAMYADGNGDWEFKDPSEDLKRYLTEPRDIKQTERQADAGVMDTRYRELEIIECHLQWTITNDATKRYDIVALIQPGTDELIDVYFSPYSRNLNVFTDYRPFPRESLWYGESLCEILGTAQEEASTIHNDRRNNSFIANSVVFKRRNGSLVPNPSTNWYPGKVFDLEDINDLDAMTIGTQYASDMIPQEDYTFKLAQQVSGIGEEMQGTAAGQAGTGGVYNTMGTLSVMAEGNQRQDTNIRDVRMVLGSLIDTCSRMQATYGAKDPLIDEFDTATAANIRKAFTLLNSRSPRVIRHEARASSAGANSEVKKATLLQMSQILGQYGQYTLQMAQQLMNPSINPGQRALMNDILNMQTWMAKRIVREFGEADAVEALPDVAAAIEQAVPGGSKGSGPQGGGSGAGNSGGAGDVLPPLSGAQLQSLASLPKQGGGPS